MARLTSSAAEHQSAFPGSQRGENDCLRNKPSKTEQAMTRRHVLVQSRTAIVSALAILASMLGGAADATEGFIGKQIRMIIPAAQAGGYAPYGQLAVQHLGRFIPGNPTIVISYMP